MGSEHKKRVKTRIILPAFVNLFILNISCDQLLFLMLTKVEKWCVSLEKVKVHEAPSASGWISFSFAQHHRKKTSKQREQNKKWKVNVHYVDYFSASLQSKALNFAPFTRGERREWKANSWIMTRRCGATWTSEKIYKTSQFFSMIF